MPTVGRENQPTKQDIKDADKGSDEEKIERGANAEPTHELSGAVDDTLPEENIDPIWPRVKPRANPGDPDAKEDILTLIDPEGNEVGTTTRLNWDRQRGIYDSNGLRVKEDDQDENTFTQPFERYQLSGNSGFIRADNPVKPKS